tara:strand:- start:11923 stop:13245 length:1323 start_codon:yes stop_codon:yes gene_type:complete
MRWAVYRAATVLLLPAVLAYFIWRSRREADYRRHLSERLGYVTRRYDRPIWIHAASVGEVALAAALVSRLRQMSQVPIIVTTMTPTGRAAARRALGAAALGAAVDVAYLPLDTATATRRFVTRVRPRSALLIETELWPNLIDALSRAAVPIAMLNASISARSAERYGRALLRGLMGDTFSRLGLIGAASDADAARFKTLGCRPDCVQPIGQLKYDLVTLPDEDAAPSSRAAAAARGPLIVAGSTHEDEEARWLDVFTRVRAAHPDARLILAPRHPQRFDDVAALLRQSSWQWSRFSQTGVNSEAEILLVDTLGVLAGLYQQADIAFVGGTLVAGIGGHNVIEPAAAGCVVVTGPHCNDWRSISAPWCRSGGAAVVADDAELGDQVVAWLADRSRCRALGQANARQVQTERGAICQSLDVLTAAGFFEVPAKPAACCGVSG